jgi:hypothetical protein
LLAPQTAGEGRTLLPFRLLRRRGLPFLLLPMEPSLARQTLSLYPAQSVRARAVRAALSGCLRLGCSAGAARVDLPVATRSAFVEFLKATAGSDALPRIGALAGNPAEAGRRVVFLLFDRDGRARRVVKAGHGGPAATLIEAELTALRALPAGTPGAPRVLGELGHGGTRAFALEFFEGDSPRADDVTAPLALLHRWIHRERAAPLARLHAWHRLREACAGEAWFGRLESSLARAVVRPVIAHGQFNPWNIKVSPRDRSWTVLDWERGELEGVPAWDWFHFVIQSEVLVRRHSPGEIAKRLDRILASGPFQDYARAAQVAGLERSLLVGYLAFMARVIRPAESLPATRELLRLLVPACG